LSDAIAAPADTINSAMARNTSVVPVSRRRMILLNRRMILLKWLE